MLPLALTVRALGHEVAGSDRALDQGRSGEKFDFLRSKGIGLFAQDGSGLTDPRQILIASAAIEDTVPDVAAAISLGAIRMTRAELLASLFNQADRSIAIGGTSGKSTTTAMIGWIYAHAERNPTIVNGAVMKNFVNEDVLFASAVAGDPGQFICEVDESDGSIALFHPKISVLNNISLDHKSMDELRTLFKDFVDKAECAVINLDNDESEKIAAMLKGKARTYSLEKSHAEFFATDITSHKMGISFKVAHEGGAPTPVNLKMPGRHNVSNALAAIATAFEGGIPLEEACRALDHFTGVKRRFEFVGDTNDIVVIDDFGHNPDKISATFSTLNDFPGRLLVMFQPHGFGPLRKMKPEFIQCFAAHLSDQDHLLMPQPVYFGGTVDRSVTSDDIVEELHAKGLNAKAYASRKECGDHLLELAAPGDRVVIMGARDDTLSEFAEEILHRLQDKFARQN